MIVDIIKYLPAWKKYKLTNFSKLFKKLHIFHLCQYYKFHLLTDDGRRASSPTSNKHDSYVTIPKYGVLTHMCLSDTEYYGRGSAHVFEYIKTDICQFNMYKNISI